MKAIGITCGIGSMLVGARKAGFRVAGNVEWRKYYHYRDPHGMNTFEANFPDAPFPYSLDHMTADEIERFMDADLALGHPECGAFSNLRNVRTTTYDDPCDIPLFVDLVAKFQPRFFVMDDLPPSLDAFPMSEYVARLPDYDLFPEWISNYHYGNVQKNRKRMFMIGARKEERWAFMPGEDPDRVVTMRDTIGDLCDESGFAIRGQVRNHHDHVLDVVTGRAMHLNARGQTATWRDLREWFLRHEPGKAMEYHAADGTIKVRFGLSRVYWDGHCHVLIGTQPTIHPLSGLPMSIRERARVQGFPDDFVFYGEVLEDDLTWNHDRNNHMIKQTGKAMPIQFCQYVSEQVAAHIRGDGWKASNKRALAPNAYIDREKQWYCENVGYADQDRACGSCWLYSQCTIRARKYQIGKPAVEQLDLFDPGVAPIMQQDGCREGPIEDCAGSA